MERRDHRRRAAIRGGGKRSQLEGSNILVYNDLFLLYLARTAS